jgi:hypothetical protein
MSADISKPAATTVNVDLPAAEPWTVAAYMLGQKASWLTVTPSSGKGPGQVNLSASAAGLTTGSYSAILVFQAPSVAPRYVLVPVTFTIGGASDMSISGTGNAASFQQVFAPGMLMSLMGTHLSITTKAADSVPLPERL